MAKQKKSSLKERMKDEGVGKVDVTSKSYDKPIIQVEYVKTKNKK